MVRHPHQRRIEITLFLTCFAAYGYFHQGGGWNQTARFDQVRAIVETGHLHMNEYMVYQVLVGEGGRSEIVRQPFNRGSRLNSGDYTREKLNGKLYYPNKPPGTTFLAVPAYWVVYRIGKLAGVNPDTVWNLNFNAYLTTIFSVGLFAALGVVIFLRLSQLMFPDLPTWTHVAATLTFAFGTLVLPFSTLLFDHVPVAVLLMAAFYLIVRDGGDIAGDQAGTSYEPLPYGRGSEKRRGSERQRGVAKARLPWRPLMAGLAAGYAVVCNYPAALGVALLTVYAFMANRPRVRILLFLAGGGLMALLLAAYHNTCFGSPLNNANTFQNEQFKEKTQSLLFGMISLPDAWICIKLMFGSYRGLFFSSPVLLLAGIGFWEMFSRRRLWREAAACLALFVTFLLFNSSFNGWHGGYTMGPRYLIPAIPFLALPLAVAFARLWQATLPLAAVSVFAMFLGVIVTPLPPENRTNPIWDFLFPVAFSDPKGGDFNRFKGPVSAWPSGFQGVRVTSEEWNSFNIGEFLWPQSGLSVVPLMVIVLSGMMGVMWMARSRESLPDITVPRP